MPMSELTPNDFSAYFRGVHGHDPFPWQQRLTAQVLGDERWPDVIDLPTGTGKTAVLDTAVFALAAKPEVFPRRVVFVIDRRIVVDQVVERAQQIQTAIHEGMTPLLQNMKERLEAIGGGSPLGVAALRGGKPIPLDGEWARRPDEPWVMVSTVDQYGSRLLFRGYGVSPRMRPVLAGLAGNDCLVVLDEVHLSRAFAETLQETAASKRSSSLPKRFQIVEMSATPANSAGRRFKLTEADLEESAELRRRARAAKSATLHDAGTKLPHIAVPAAVRKILKSEVDKPVRSVGVIVNRVRTARETHQMLLESGYSAHLITGRMRPLDKARSLEAISELVDPDNRLEADSLTVVVATQAIEVGADFSFDALITEVAPIDSLRQRFGRLDRRGRLAAQTGEPAKAWILGTKSTLNPKRPDPVYGDSARATWEELQKLERLGPIDFSPHSEMRHQYPEECHAPSAHAPLLLPTYMDAWAQTSPEPIVQPDVNWFLHGIEQEPQPADVNIVWRHDQSLQTLQEVPPRSVEHLQVPIYAAQAWLGGSQQEIEVADVKGGSEETKRLDEARGVDWRRWQGYGEEPESVSVGDIQPGDILIVDPRRGGLTGGTWDPSSTEPVEDLGDAAQADRGQRFTLRLDRRLMPDVEGWPSPPRPDDEATADLLLADRVEQWLAEVASMPDLAAWQQRTIQELQNSNPIKPKRLGDYYMLDTGGVDSAAFDGSDQSSSFTGSGVTLREHLDGVGQRAFDYASRLGLSAELQDDLRLAARLHDLGKVDSRFQKQMIGSDEVRQAMLDEPLAKSLPGARRERGKWPPVRHEIMSVAMAQSNSEVLADAHDPDLVLHLVGTHHGFARPLPPIRRDDCPETLRFDHEGSPVEASTDLVDGPLALEMADRFWRLVERYGHHGLAWLEAILRLADHQVSAEEAKR